MCDYLSGTYDISCLGTCDRSESVGDSPISLVDAFEQCGSGVEIGDK